MASVKSQLGKQVVKKLTTTCIDIMALYFFFQKLSLQVKKQKAGTHTKVINF